MNYQSYRALADGMEAWARGEQRTRDEKFRAEMLKRQGEGDSLDREMRNRQIELGLKNSAAELGERRLDRESRERIAGMQIEGRQPTGMQADLLSAEVDAARANAERLRQQTAANRPSRLSDDLALVDDWARESFRAGQALQQAQGVGDAEQIAMAQARLARLQSLGQKYGSEKPKERKVKVRMPIYGPDQKESGYREWEEDYDPSVHTISGTGAPQPSGPIVPLNSIEALRARMMQGR